MQARALICLFGLALAISAPGAARSEPSPCLTGELQTGTVARVIDARTLMLDDGRALRLSGIEALPAGPADDDATAALRTMALGRTIVWQSLETAPDRHGRMAGYVAAEPSQTLQQTLLAQGYARAAARIGAIACARALFAAEREARTARLGLWAEPDLAPLPAGEPAAILASRGRFALVEGRIVSVRESGATLYINFGRRWSEDFTASLPKRSEKAFAAAGLPLRTLAGRLVRIRGTVEERGGPWIELLRPEQIELAEPN